MLHYMYYLHYTVHIMHNVYTVVSYRQPHSVTFLLAYFITTIAVPLLTNERITPGNKPLYIYITYITIIYMLMLVSNVYNTMHNFIHISRHTDINL